MRGQRILAVATERLGETVAGGLLFRLRRGEAGRDQRWPAAGPRGQFAGARIANEAGQFLRREPKGWGLASGGMSQRAKGAAPAGGAGP